jgi:hypothetical protein
MNKDNSWWLTFSLLYVMQLPSIYFDVLEISGHWNGAASCVIDEHEK